MNEVVTKENVDYLRLYEYTDLSRFQTFGRNRQIMKSHVNNLKKDMLEYGLKYFSAIMIDINSMICVEGNHRLTALRELYSEGKLTEPVLVRYIDAPTDPEELLKLIIRINVKSKHWVLKDFIRAGNLEGSPISKLIEFCVDETRPLLHKISRGGAVNPNYRYGMAITIGRNDTKTISNSTTVNISEEDFEAGARYYTEAAVIVEALGLSDRVNTWLEAFLQAWYAIRKDPAYSEMVDRIGMDNLCAAITPSDFTTTNKNQWEAMFKSLIWRVNSRQ